MGVKHIRPRAEEVAIGAMIGAGVGMVAALPFVAPLPTIDAITAGGWFGIFRAGVLCAAGLTGAGFGGWAAWRQERDSHLRGARYIDDPQEARRELRASERRSFGSEQAAGKVSGVRIGGVELSRTREVGHVYAVGLPGAGKTVLLTSIIDQAIARRDRIIIHDPKGDLTARYYDPQTMVLMGPWDERAALWDASSDIDTPALANEFAQHVITGGSAKANEGNAKFFNEGAARLLGGLIRSYQVSGESWTWADLSDAVGGKDPIALVQQAARGDAVVKMSFATVFPSDPQKAPALEREGPSIMATLANQGGWLIDFGAVDKARPAASRFSLRKWLLGEAHNDTRVVILNSNALYPRACENLFGAMLATVAATLASPKMPEISSAAPGTWMILDEFAQLGQTSFGKIQQIAELGRSRGVREVLALQDESQLPAKVGHDAAEPMLAMQSTRVYMLTGDKSADAISRRIGQCDVYRIENTSENGAVQGKSKRIHTKQAVLAGDILGLRVLASGSPKGVEMILHAGNVLGKLVHPFTERRPDICPKFVESEAWKRGSLPSGDMRVGIDDARGSQDYAEPDGASEDITRY